MAHRRGYCRRKLRHITDGLRRLKKIKTKALSILSDTQRKYLHLRNEEGMSLDEISSLTGKPKNSIKSSISSARRAMLEIIKKEL